MDEPTFLIFGPSHLATLLVILAACLLVARHPPPPDSILVRGSAWLLLCMALIKPVLFIGIYDHPWQRSLPLDLCRINELLCAYMLLARSYRAFEVAYFLAIAGSTAALLTPDLQQGFPHPRFLLFFVSHGLAVVTVVYAISGFGFRPTLRSVGITLLFLATYTALMGGVNVLLDANYLFLMEKPAGASIIDMLGPWPWYVAWLVSIAIVLCFACYLPFAVARRWAGR